MAAGLRSKLDMRHGFMKSIIQNQVDRDTYDKEIKAKLTDKPKPKQNKQKKPDIHVYVPPTKLKEMFVLEFEDKDGSVYSTSVYKNDSASAIAQKIGEERNLPADYIAVLQERLHYEISTREGLTADPNS
ncbi:UPF0561 protein C2orf68 homolog [Ostrea edulis]|uniref:UPF0561 protein C2orf68 homolog n=1 Tax=Ostrea edulis TaxID=37623 RepID=UPI0020941CEE|nr:UPF0561 protein C2orf68 homolog [Ostrea edulis]